MKFFPSKNILIMYGILAAQFTFYDIKFKISIRYSKRVFTFDNINCCFWENSNTHVYMPCYQKWRSYHLLLGFNIVVTFFY